MKRSEAYQTLELNESSSDDDIKKAFRKLAAQHHPDKNNGSKESEEKFKKVNTAFQILSGKETADDDRNNSTYSYSNHSSRVDLNDIFNIMNNSGHGGSPFDQFFGKERQRSPNQLDFSPINVFMKLSFEESVLGCDKKISYQKKSYCSNCDGLGKAKDTAKQCRSCNGSGVIRQQMGNGMIIQIHTAKCVTCAGSGIIGDSCKNCSGVGYKTEEQTLNLKIPPIGSSNVTLAANGKGNSFKGQAGDVLISVSPTSEGTDKYKDFILDGRDVCMHTRVNLDILLFGGTIKVPVIGGDDQEVVIPPLTQTEQEFYLQGFGARKMGNFPNGKQVVSIKANYPDKNKLSNELLNELSKSYER